MTARIPWCVLALPAAALARLTPAHGVGLALRLTAATLVLLVPGALLARALRVRGAAATLALSLAALFVALAVTFAVGGSLRATLLVLAIVAAAALPAALVRTCRPLPREELGGAACALALGAGLGVALWHVAGRVDGDALFHLGRVRKLDEFGDLSLRAVDEFRDGGLHPGYAFPLWHGLLACVARLAGVDPTSVVLHEASVLAPLALVVAYEAGVLAFESAALGVAVALAGAALFALAPGHGGAYATLALPSESGWHLLAPAALALFLLVLRRPAPGTLAAAAAGAGVLVVVHPTYALFLALPVAGFVLARWVLTRADVRVSLVAAGTAAIPIVAFLAWLAPLVRETAAHDETGATRRRDIARYADQIVQGPHGRLRLEPEMFTRRGTIAVAALAAIPLAALAARRRWAALVLGGSLAVLAVMLVPYLFTPLADAVSLSQVRRAVGFLPYAFALVGGATVLARVLHAAVVPVGLAIGVALQLVDPSDFGKLDPGGPGLEAWIVLAAGSLALVAGAVLGRRVQLERPGLIAAAAAVAVCIPAAVAGARDWKPLDREGADPLTAGLVRALRTRVPEKAVVWAEPETSYRIAAFAPVYVAVAPPTHVADTTANRPYARYRDAARFRRTGDLAIPRRYGATWLVTDRRRTKRRFGLPVVYRDSRYTLYRLRR